MEENMDKPYQRRIKLFSGFNDSDVQSKIDRWLNNVPKDWLIDIKDQKIAANDNTGVYISIIYTYYPIK